MNRKLVIDFIEQIWNNRNFSMLDKFLHSSFQDHSLPASLTPDKEGLRKWITGTGISFEHRTKIEDQVMEGDKVAIKIRMELKHIGVWRDIQPTGISLYTPGYRFFELKEGKIIEHWALIDGQTIENQLKNVSHGCKISE